MQDIIVLLLAAGDSTRMWPLPDKHFLEYLEKSLIGHVLSQLYKWGLRNFIIISNAENRIKFQHLVEANKDKNIQIIIQENKDGMGGAVLSAKHAIRSKKILVVGPSDIFEDILLSDFERLLKEDPDGIITGTTKESYFPGAYLTVEKGQIKGIIEKPKPDKLPSNIVTFVFDYFKNAENLISAIESIGTDKEDSFERAIELLVSEGSILRLLHYRGFWGYMKYPWHVLNVSSYFLNKINNIKIMDKTLIDESAVISGNVFIQEGVRILENAKVIGPAYIGRGTIIGNNAIVRESMVGENCVIGFGCEIVRSHIGDNCWFHSNYIGDSVISCNVSMGAGSILANFRLDEDIIKSAISKILLDTGKIKLGAIIGENVRIGVNTSIMPGVKIGRDSFIGAGVVLDRDLPEEKYCSLASSNYKIAKNKIKIPNGLRNTQRSELKFK